MKDKVEIIQEGADLELAEDEKKKEYLKGYKIAVRQMERSELKMQEIRLSRICTAVLNDGISHAYSNNDLSSYAAVLDQEEKRYLKYRYQRIEKCKEITARIECLSDEDQKDVLTYRYIKLMKWEDICERMKFSWKQVHRIHLMALKNFRIN